MTTMELEAQKAMLAREILNTDSSELLKEMSKAYHRIKARMQKDKSVKEYTCPEEDSGSCIVGEPTYEYGCAVEADIETDSDESIIKGIKKSLHTLSDIKAGRVKTRPARELLKELEEED
ncbi:hypothetical protein [Bacteroides timonensis]|uniref:hypothetical protein n=1 Tax=Bacteroides timonensis TaxID=1470345 RepID=UPI0004B76D60|nr:hypothetical protein [Bacteroides timonensis]